MNKSFFAYACALILCSSLIPTECSANVAKYDCRIDQKQKPDVWRAMQMMDIFYSEQILVIDEQKRYVAIYQRFGIPPHPLLWNYQNPSKWHDGDIVPEGQGASGAGNGISYVRTINGELNFGVVWGGWPTTPITFNKSTGVLHDTFTYYCEPAIDIDNNFK